MFKKLRFPVIANIRIAVLLFVAVIALNAATPVLNTVAGVQAVRNDQAQQHFPVRIEAVVTYFDPEWGLLFIQDQTAGMYVDAHKQKLPDCEGRLVALTGMTEAGDIAPMGYRSHYPGAQDPGKRPRRDAATASGKHFGGEQREV